MAVILFLELIENRRALRARNIGSSKAPWKYITGIIIVAARGDDNDERHRPHVRRGALLRPPCAAGDLRPRDERLKRHALLQ